MNLIQIKSSISRFFRELRIFNPYGNGFHEEERKLKRSFYNEIGGGKNNGCKRIVVMNDGRSWHAGLSDRLRAMASVYSWCKQHGIEFKVYCVSPFNLHDYLVPNKYDWQIDAVALCYNAHHSRPYLLNSHQLPCRWHDLYLRWMMIGYDEIHLYTNTYFRDNRFYENFNELFKPSDKLKQKIDEQRAKLPKRYVVFAFRFLELLGDFKDCVTTPLDEKSKEVLIRKCMDKVQDLHDTFYRDYQIVVTADSKTFINRAQETFDYVHTIPGEVGHIDYTSKDDNDVHLKAFLDMYLISYADEVVLLATGEMYDKSGFAMRGAMIGDKKFRVERF